MLIDPGELYYQQALSYQYNLLSGHVPAVYEVPHTISMLRGNMFTCLLDKSDLPQNDESSRNYQCGSDDYNVPY